MSDDEMVAEFIGLITYAPTFNGIPEVLGWYDPRKELLDHERFNGGRLLHKSELKVFSESWEHLMLVVDKIETMNAEVKIVENTCFITTKGTGYAQGSPHNYHKTKKEVVYSAIVQFIKWHNLNKK